MNEFYQSAGSLVRSRNYRYVRRSANECYTFETVSGDLIGILSDDDVALTLTASETMPHSIPVLMNGVVCHVRTVTLEYAT